MKWRFKIRKFRILSLKTRQVKPLFFAVCLAVLAGCATPQRPQVFIAAPVDEVRPKIVSELMGSPSKWSLVQEGQTLLVFERDAGIAASIFLGSTWNPTVHQQTRFTLLPRDGGTQVWSVVTMRNGGRDLGDNTGSFQVLDHFLQCVKADLEGTPRPAPLPPPTPAPAGKPVHGR